MTRQLAWPGHAAAEPGSCCATLRRKCLKKSKETYEFGNVLGTMVRVLHPAATDSLIAMQSKRFGK